MEKSRTLLCTPTPRCRGVALVLAEHPAGHFGVNRDSCSRILFSPLVVAALLARCRAWRREGFIPQTAFRGIFMFGPYRERAGAHPYPSREFMKTNFKRK